MRYRSIFSLGSLLVSAGKLAAAPSGGVVTAGTANIVQKGAGIAIHQKSDRAIIDWKGFSIGKGERVDFSQPSSGSAVLNRVSGFEASAIQGTLSANGQVYLMNPRGIIIGAGGIIDTGGFVATTGTISDLEFLAGKSLHISGAREGITNSGRILAKQGDVVLIARQVDNSGAITASGGVSLGAGTEVLLRETVEGRLSVRVKGNGGIDQSGTISAAQVELKAAGGNPYSLAINHQGVTRATGAVRSGGKVILTGGGGVKIAGKIKASGKSRRGGKIDVGGKTVEVAGNAELDASGRDAGGSIRIGGGKDAGPTNADHVTVENGAILNASSTGSGSGGRVSVWSEISTLFAGEVSVEGGIGGFAEISSSEHLDFTGHANLAGSTGANGTLLLDPTDLTIGAVQAASIVSSLGSGNVVVATSPNGAGAGNLTIASAVDYTSSNILLFLAHGDIRVNASVKNGGSGELIAIAGWDGSTGAAGGLDGADFLANPVSYGNSGGSVFVGDAAQATAVNFASRFGDVTLAGSSMTIAGGSATSAYSQVGWNAILQGSSYTVTGNIAIALKGDLTLRGGSATYSEAQIGHGGTISRASSSTIDGDFSGNIAITVDGATLLNGGSAERSTAQIGHGGFLSRGRKSGDISLDTGSLTLLSSNFDYSSTQIGHGGNLGSLDQNYSGRIDVNSIGDINMTSGGRFDAFAQIGHGGRGTAGASPVSFTGDIHVTGRNLTMSMVSSGTSHVQIGNGGERAAGNHGGNISVDVRDLTMTASGQHSFMQIGHGGSDGDLTGDIDIQARDLILWANNGNTTSSQIGLASTKGNSTGNTAVNARDIVLKAGGSYAWARIGMGKPGYLGTVNDNGEIVVNGRNLTMIGGNSFYSPAKIGHGTLEPGVMQGDIHVTMTGETSLERNPNGSGATISHITTTQTNGVINSDWFLTTGTLDTSSTATATGVVLDSYLASVFAEAGQFGNATLTATGLNGNDGQLTVQNNYTGFSPFTVTFASTRDISVNAPVTFQANWVGNIRMIFGQATGGTLRLNAAVSTPGSGVASAMGGAGDDSVIFGTSGFIEAGIDGGSGLNTLWGDSGSNAFTITGSNSGALSGKIGTSWQNFQNLEGEGGNDIFTIINSGSLGGTIGGGTGTNTLTGANAGNLFAITGVNSGLLQGKTAGWSDIQILNGGAGSDRFVFGPGGSLSQSLAGGSGDDTLQLADGGQPVSVTGTNSGIYGPITGSGWSGIENVTGGSGADRFVFTNSGRIDGFISGGGGNDTLRGDDDGNSFLITGSDSGGLLGKMAGWSGIASLEGGTAPDQFELGGMGALSGAIKGGGGADELIGNNAGNIYRISGINSGSIAGLVPSWQDIESLRGGNGSDLFVFESGGGLSQSLAGGSGDDTLQLDDSGVEMVTIVGLNSGIYGPIAGSGWSGVENVTGGSGDDRFAFTNAGRLDGIILGGGGTDTLRGDDDGNSFTITAADAGTLAGKTAGWSGISSLEGGDGADDFLFTTAGVLSGSIHAGAGIDSLTGNTAGNTFRISGNGSGSIDGLVTFWEDVENVIGGSGDDRFVIGTGGMIANLAGGAGNDTLQLMDGGSQKVTITGANSGEYAPVANWSGIENLTGGDGDDCFTFTNGGHLDGLILGNGGNNLLIGDDDGNVFNLTGANAGTLPGKTAGWSGIGSLKGGAGVDDFLVAAGGSLTGGIEGAGGSDRLIGKDMGNRFVISNVDSGSLVGRINFWTSIENLIGGAADDTFEFGLSGFLSGILDGDAGRNRVVAPDINSIFEVTGINRGQLVGKVSLPWTNIQDLDGGAGDDLFHFIGGRLSGAINGQGGINTLQGADAGSVFSLTGVNSGGLVNGTSAWSNISILRGGLGHDIFLIADGGTLKNGLIDGGAGGNSLEAMGPLSRKFHVNGRDSGSLSGLGSSWKNISSLAGGGGDDRFVFLSNGSLSGTIAGGGGLDELDYSRLQSGVTVDFSAGIASRTSIGVEGIEIAVGSRLDDTLTAGSGTVLLEGGRGNDLFIASPGQPGHSLQIRGGGGNNEFQFDATATHADAGYRITAGGLVRKKSGFAWENWDFTDISLLNLALGTGRDQVETSGLDFIQHIDGGTGAPNQLIVDGAGYGLVNPASPILIDGNGEIVHWNFDTVTITNAATPLQVREIIDDSSGSFEVFGRSELLRFLWFLDSGVQTRRQPQFLYLDKDGNPIKIMASAEDAN